MESKWEKTPKDQKAAISDFLTKMDYSLKRMILYIRVHLLFPRDSSKIVHYIRTKFLSTTFTVSF